MINKNTKNPHIYTQPVICQPRKRIGFNFDKSKKQNHNNYKLINQTRNTKEINELNNEYINKLKIEQKEIDDKKKIEKILNLSNNDEKGKNEMNFSLSNIEVNIDNLVSFDFKNGNINLRLSENDTNTNINIKSNNTVKFDLKPITVDFFSIDDNNNESININKNNYLFFDIRIINNNVHNINTNEHIQNTNINDLYKNNVKIINNVYRESYANNVKCTGFGDFIRGCYFLLYFCDKYNFIHNIIIDHPISTYLENNNYENLSYKNNFESIKFLTNSNFEAAILNNKNNISSFSLNDNFIYEFIDYLNSTKIYNSNIFIYNIIFPHEIISENHKRIIRTLLEPNSEMKIYVNNTLQSLNLLNKKYIVIHIRSGDKYLNSNETVFSMNYINNLVNDINSSLIKNYDYLLLCDNNYIKKFVTDFFPFIKSFSYPITHLGEGVTLDLEKVKNTLLDFYLFSKCSYIKAYSSNDHGTGFSYWCSITYNIPYSCKIIK